MSIVVWREWYNENAVKKLTEMGTLPSYEIEIDGAEWLDGEELAETIAELTNASDGEQFCERGEIVIIKPADAAGTYDIQTDYHPRFYASKRGPDEE